MIFSKFNRQNAAKKFNSKAKQLWQPSLIVFAREFSRIWECKEPGNEFNFENDTSCMQVVMPSVYVL